MVVANRVLCRLRYEVFVLHASHCERMRADADKWGAIIKSIGIAPI